MPKLIKLDAVASKSTFPDLGHAPKQEHFSIKIHLQTTQIDASGLQAQISRFGPGSQTEAFPYQLHLQTYHIVSSCL